MSLEEFYYVSQIVASVAVLASLIYLALQTRLTARNQMAMMHENRIQTITHDTEIMMDPAFTPVLNRGMAGDDTLNDDEVMRFQLFGRSMLVQWEERFRQKSDGMLDNDRWKSTQASIRGWMTAPGNRAVFQIFRGGLGKDFCAEVDRLLIESSELEIVQISNGWRALVVANR